jgi:hypothetical protein
MHGLHLYALLAQRSGLLLLRSRARVAVTCVWATALTTSVGPRLHLCARCCSDVNLPQGVTSYSLVAVYGRVSVTLCPHLQYRGAIYRVPITRLRGYCFEGNNMYIMKHESTVYGKSTDR